MRLDHLLSKDLLTKPFGLIIMALGVLFSFEGICYSLGVLRLRLRVIQRSWIPRRKAAKKLTQGSSLV